MAPLNMGGTLRQQQHKVFVQFYSVWCWCADLILCGAQHIVVLCIRRCFALACVQCLVFSVSVGHTASCKFQVVTVTHQSGNKLSSSSFNSLFLGPAQFLFAKKLSKVESLEAGWVAVKRKVRNAECKHQTGSPSDLGSPLLWEWVEDPDQDCTATLFNCSVLMRCTEQWASGSTHSQTLHNALCGRGISVQILDTA